MEILITGGNGFLGRHLVLALQERGDSVRVLASPRGGTTWLEHRGVAIFRGDVRAPAELTAPMGRADAVVHLVAEASTWGPMQDSYAVNVTGTENVCQAALTAGVRRLVHISTFTVYDIGLGRPLTEEEPLAPLNEPYSRTKAEADRLVQHMSAQDPLPPPTLPPGLLPRPPHHPHPPHLPT